MEMIYKIEIEMFGGIDGRYFWCLKSCVQGEDTWCTSRAGWASSPEEAFEEGFKKLLSTYYNYNALDRGGVDNWEGCEYAYENDLRLWNEGNVNKQFDDWSNMMEYFVEEDIKVAKEKGFIYLLWEDDAIIGCYTSIEAVDNRLDEIISGYIAEQAKVTWANENCGITFVENNWGETIEYQIQEVKVNDD